MRDWQGIDPAVEPDSLRRDKDQKIDYFLRDLSRGMSRIQKGEIPDGSGTKIIDVQVSDKYWYKPGISPFGTAFMDTAAGGTGIISSTAHSTKGYVYLGGSTGLSYDETNVFVGLLKAVPSA